MQVIPYLHFDGQCKAAFDFYARTFDGQITITMTYGEAPAGMHGPENAQDRIMHTCLRMGGMHIMGCDVPAGPYEGMKGVSISLHPADPAEAQRIYDALADGGTVRLALQETFWAKTFGMLTDRFGTAWMISCDKPPAGAAPSAPA